MSLRNTKIKNTTQIPNAPIKFIWHVTKNHKGWAALAFLFAGLGEMGTIFEVLTISRLVDDFGAAEGVEAQLDVLVFWGLIFISIMLIGKVIWRLSGFTGIKWIVESHATAYKMMYEYLVGHSHSYFSDRFAGAISNKVSNATDGSVRLAERTLWGTVPEIISLIATVIVFWFIHYSLALLVIGILLGLIVFNLYRVKYRRPHVVAFAAASSKVRGEGVDLITNIAAARQYVRQTNELERIGFAIDDRRHKDLKQWFMGEWTLVYNSAASFLYIFCYIRV